MRQQILTILFIITAFNSALCQDTSVVFENRIHDFGEISDQDTQTYLFYFDNFSKDTLIIKNIKTTCGCTVAEYPKITPPRTRSFVKINFDATNKQGRYSKGVNIFTNKGEYNLIVNATVVRKPEENSTKIDTPE